MAGLRRFGLLLVIAAALNGLVTGVALAQSGPFATSVSTFAVPAGTNNNVGSISTACGTTGCESVGYDYSATSHEYAFAAAAASGTAGTGQIVPLPNGSDASSPYAKLYGVSCWSADSCVAVGDYDDSSGTSQALVVPIIGGIPQQGVEVSLPQGAAQSPEAYLYGVSCAFSDVCEAVGYYYEQSGSAVPLVVPITNGVPAGAAQIQLPSDAVPSSQDSLLYAVSCWSAGNCAAVGYYDTANGAQPLLVELAGGVQSSAARVALPKNAEASAQVANLNIISCWAAGSCAAGGSYRDTSAAAQQMGDVISSTGPATATEIAMPADATGSVNLDRIACNGGGVCVGVGGYLDATSSSYAWDVEIAGGVVGPGQDVTLPGDASTGHQWAGLSDVSCPPVGACMAVGSYINTSVVTQPMMLVWTGPALPAATSAPVPADQNASPNAGLADVGCGPSGSCAAFGAYNNKAGDYVPYGLSAQSPLTIGTTSLPAGTVGSPYSASLTATGGWGPYAWSLLSGNLPLGLSANLVTGAISGTPTTPGTATVGFGVAGTGSPLQTATQSLSISVPTPVLKLAKASAEVKRSRFGLTLSCTGGACAGSGGLQITELITVKHGRKRVHKRRSVQIASVRFSLAAGQTTTLASALNGTGRKALAKAHRLNATLTATVDTVKESPGKVSLRAAAVKHKKRKHR